MQCLLTYHIIQPRWVQVFESAVVRRVDQGLGLLCELPTEGPQGGLPLAPGYAHISNLADSKVEDLCQVGGAHRLWWGVLECRYALVAAANVHNSPCLPACALAPHFDSLPAHTAPPRAASAGSPTDLCARSQTRGPLPAPPFLCSTALGSGCGRACWVSAPWTAWRC